MVSTRAVTQQEGEQSPLLAPPPLRHRLPPVSIRSLGCLFFLHAVRWCSTIVQVSRLQHSSGRVELMLLQTITSGIGCVSGFEGEAPREGLFTVLSPPLSLPYSTD